MLKLIMAWLSGLSLVGKIFAYSSTAIIGGTMISAAVNHNVQEPKKPLPTPPAVEGKQTEPKVESKTITESTEVPFDKTTVEDGNLAKGKTEVRTVGVNGIKTYTYKITLADGVQTNKELIKEEVTTSPVTEVTAIGTKAVLTQNCDPNYTPCVPNVSYDLDCPDIGFSVVVIGYDRHGFDGNDNDGYGCE